MRTRELNRLETPPDIPVLAPMITREIHYRLLNGLYGRRIEQMAINGTNTQRIAHVIHMLKTNILRTNPRGRPRRNGSYEPVIFPYSFQKK
jgi:hypothetical protein